VAPQIPGELKPTSEFSKPPRPGPRPGTLGVVGTARSMRKIRIIPRLDIKGPNLVKGIHLEGLRIMGDPHQFATRYYREGADELFYVDIVASLYQRNNLADIVRKTARDIFIPLTGGGGVRTLDDIRMLLRWGADKVSINTAAVARPELIREAAEAFGSQCITVAVDFKIWPDGSYRVYTDNGREQTRWTVIEWVLRAAELGAGELVITSVDREGTGRGFEVNVIRQVTESVSIPVIAGGGAGSIDHVVEIIEVGGADAVAIASLFHYDRIGIDLLKNALAERGIPLSRREVMSGG
jgi:cyclase